MKEEDIINKSLENLNIFEYYLFRRTFALAFIYIGIVNVLIIWADLTLRILLYSYMFYYLSYVILKIDVTKIENGKIYKYKNHFGLIITFLISLIAIGGDQIIGSFFYDYPVFCLNLVHFIIYFDTIMILVLYYLLHSIYFPRRHLLLIKLKLLVLTVIGIIVFLFLNTVGTYIILTSQHLIPPSSNPFMCYSEYFNGLRLSYVAYYWYLYALSWILLAIFGLIDYKGLKNILSEGVIVDE